MLLANAARSGRTVIARQAIAEATGLEDASVDFVTAGQAFHWFDATRAVPEIARILRPGGGVALFWNVRDHARSPFLTAYADLLEAHVPDARHEERVPHGRSHVPDKLGGGGWFDVVPDRIDLEHTVDMGAAEFMGLAFTASIVRVTLDDEGLARFADDLRRLIDEYAVDGRLAIPYCVHVWLARRRP